MRLLSLGVLSLSFLCCLALPTASADVAPPNLAGCQGKTAGASCQTDDKKSGACVAQKCTKLDYSQGTPPKSVEYDCVLCDASKTPTTPTTPTPKAGCQTLTSGPTSWLVWLLFLGLGLALLRPKRRSTPTTHV